ncbi:hypothetical protein CHLRE_01g024000v5 [Chlamydomonas reinhardtii]|uniref:Uncharacterized protein n=1 Tax=Chlamydomonas reinhardtii TaxID=3055 RepID=A0A2K3E6B2_CHLRE|nr:uncharacterized protein CHLRE_01g024000v5 [Chlamydomonas reinhardtii]PNW88316.1 hypothetical protein CHLRE_01g024000v5 [Chlamydomonas reinhardtii]
MQQSQAACTGARVAADAQSASAEARGRDTGRPPAPDAGSLLARALAQLAAESAARAAAEVRAERAEARASRAESRLREVITDTTLEVQRLGQQLQAAFDKIAELRDLLPDMCGAASEARAADQGSPAPVATLGHAPARADTPAAHTQPRQEQGAAEPQCSPHLRQQQHRMQQGGPSHAAAAGIPAASPPAALSHAPPAAPETPALAAASPCPKPEPQEHSTGPQHQAAAVQQHHVAAADFGSKSGSQAPVARLSAKILPPLPEATAAKAAPDSPGAQAGLQYIAAAAAAAGQAAAPAPASAGGAGGVAGSRLRVQQAPSGGWRPVTGMMLHQALAGAAGAGAALAADGPHPQQLAAASGPEVTPPVAVVAAALQAAAVAPAAQVAAAVAAPAAGPTAVPAGRSVAQAVEGLVPVRLAWSGGPQHGPPDGPPGSLWELQQRLAAVAAGGGGGALDLDFGGAELPPGPKPLPGTGALRIACGVPVTLRNAVLPACVVVEGCPRAALVNVTCRPGPGRRLLTGGGSQVVMEAVVTGLGAGTLVTMSGCFVEVKAAGGGGGAAPSAGAAAVAAAVAAAEVAAGAGSAAAVAGAAAAAGGAAASPALASSPDGLLHSCVGVLVDHGAGAVLEGCAVVGPHPRDVQLQGGALCRRPWVWRRGAPAAASTPAA